MPLASQQIKEKITQGQFNAALDHLFILHLWLLLLTVIIGCFAHFYQISFPIIYFAWAVVVLFFVGSSVLYQHVYLIKHPYKCGHKKNYLRFSLYIPTLLVCFIPLFLYVGNINTATVGTMYGNTALFALLLSTTLIVISHFVGLIVYTNTKYHSFLQFIGMTTLPMLVYYYAYFVGMPAELVFSIILYITCMLLIGYKLYSTRHHSIVLVASNEVLVSETEKQRQTALQNNEQLEFEIHERLAAQQQLKLMNQDLEEQVKKRTSVIEQINTVLERSYSRLEMANKIAGVSTWEWYAPTLTFTSDNFEALFGYSEAEKNEFHRDIPETMIPIVHPDDYAKTWESIVNHFEHSHERYSSQYRIKHKDGRWIWVQDMGKVVERNPDTKEVIKVVGVRRDITEQKKLEEKLRLSAEVFDKAAEGIFILNPKLEYIEVNPKFLSIIGQTNRNIIGKPAFTNETHRHEQILESRTLIKDLLEQYGEFDGELLDRNSDGDEIVLWIHINAVRDEKGIETHYIGIISDLTQRKIDHDRLTYATNYDTLTELPNRHLFKSSLQQLLQSHFIQNEHRNTLAIYLLDIDRFKIINDSLGTPFGDELLKQATQRLLEQTQSSQMLCRFGANTFAIVGSIEANNTNIANEHAQALIDLFDTPFTLFNQTVTVTASIGVALYPQHGKQTDFLIQSAEQALKASKSMGGHTYRLASNKPVLLTPERIAQENDLRRALANNEIVVYFQPKYHLQKSIIIGFEALARWSHPVHGIRGPFHFIPLAEELGLLPLVGEQILDKTCQQIQTWNEQGFKGVKVAVNVDAQQINRGHFLNTLDKVKSKYHICPSQLELELTESSLMDNSEEILTLFNEIKLRGNRIALDDFGTGYSALSYLSKYPIDVLKVDRSFIIEINKTAEGSAIVKAIIALGKALNLELVCEGVENKEQALFVKEQGADFLQGYYVSAPVSSSDATQMLSRHFTVPYPIELGQENHLYPKQ